MFLVGGEHTVWVELGENAPAGKADLTWWQVRGRGDQMPLGSRDIRRIHRPGQLIERLGDHSGLLYRHHACRLAGGYLGQQCLQPLAGQRPARPAHLRRAHPLLRLVR